MLLSWDHPVAAGTMMGIPTGSRKHGRGPAVVGDLGTWLLPFSCPPLAKPSCDPTYTGARMGQPPSYRAEQGKPRHGLRPTGQCPVVGTLRMGLEM